MINCVFTVNHRLRQHDVTRFDIWEQDANGRDHTVMDVKVVNVGPRFGQCVSVTPNDEL
jgi:hypothetical protein